MIDEFVRQLELYGYIIIVISLVFGIVGIPAPEETLLFLVGVMAGNEQLRMFPTVGCVISGVFIGMMIAYGLGRFVGEPILTRFGKYVGLTDSNWQKVSKGYSRNAFRTIMLALFIPGVRQLSPYFAGMAYVPFTKFCLYTLIGSTLWTIPYIIGGYYIGQIFDVDLRYIPYIGFVIFILFILYFIWKRKRVNKEVRK